jgi:hypothetical protein
MKKKNENISCRKFLRNTVFSLAGIAIMDRIINMRDLSGQGNDMTRGEQLTFPLLYPIKKGCTGWKLILSIKENM